MPEQTERWESACRVVRPHSGPSAGEWESGSRVAMLSRDSNTCGAWPLLELRLNARPSGRGLCWSPTPMPGLYGGVASAGAPPTSGPRGATVSVRASKLLRSCCHWPELWPAARGRETSMVKGRTLRGSRHAEAGRSVGARRVGPRVAASTRRPRGDDAGVSDLLHGCGGLVAGQARAQSPSSLPPGEGACAFLPPDPATPLRRPRPRHQQEPEREALDPGLARRWERNACRSLCSFPVCWALPAADPRLLSAAPGIGSVLPPVRRKPREAPSGSPGPSPFPVLGCFVV